MPLFPKKDDAKASGNKSQKRASGSSSKFSGNKTWFAFAIVAALGAAGLIFMILSQVLATTTYYVLNTAVPSRSQILPSMLTEVQASKGTEPQNSIGLEEVSYEPVFAKVDLNPGDILSASNTGDIIPLHQGIPENFVVASFVADPNSAVGGKLAAGNYVDIYATMDGGESAVTKAVLRHVLITDAQTSAEEYAPSEDAEVVEGEQVAAQDALRTGIPVLYTVAVSPEDAAVLANIRNDNLFVTLSSLESDTSFTDKSIMADKNEIFADEPVGDSGKGTDPTFGAGGSEEETSTGGGAEVEASQDAEQPVEEEVTENE